MINQAQGLPIHRLPSRKRIIDFSVLSLSRASTTEVDVAFKKTSMTKLGPRMARVGPLLNSFGLVPAITTHFGLGIVSFLWPILPLG